MFNRRHVATFAQRRPLPLFLIAVVTGTTACGSSQAEPVATLPDAQAAAAGLLRAAAAATFPPGFTLQPLTPLQLNCTDLSDRPTGRIQVGVAFWVNGVSPAHNDAAFDALHGWWARHGWTSTTDSRPTDMFTNAVSDDGYLMSLRANVEAHLVFGVTTPCVPATGTPPRPPPTTTPPASPRSRCDLATKADTRLHHLYPRHSPYPPTSRVGQRRAA